MAPVSFAKMGRSGADLTGDLPEVEVQEGRRLD